MDEEKSKISVFLINTSPITLFMVFVFYINWEYIKDLLIISIVVYFAFLLALYQSGKNINKEESKK